MYTVYDTIYLGIQGETMSRTVEIDVSELTAAFPSATIKLYLQRPVDSVPYPATNTTVTNGVMTYIPDDVDTGAAGRVLMQISAVDSSDAVLKTVIAHGRVDESLSGNVSPDPPDAVQSWIDALADDKAWADKLENVAATASTLEPGASATVAVSQTSDTTTFAFGIPKGQDGGGLASVNGKSTPNVVLYGEPLPKYVCLGAIREITNADTLIVAGTSLAVEPAASFLSHFRGKNLVVINREPIPAEEQATLVLHGDVAEIMGQLRCP